MITPSGRRTYLDVGTYLMLRPGLVGVMCPVCLNRCGVIDLTDGGVPGDAETIALDHVRVKHRLRWWAYRLGWKDALRQ